MTYVPSVPTTPGEGAITPLPGPDPLGILCLPAVMGLLSHHHPTFLERLLGAKHKNDSNVPAQ